MTFEFATAHRILFGRGALSGVGTMARSLGRRAFVVTGSSTERASALREILARQEIVYTTFCVRGEPTVETVRRGVEAARQAAAEFVIGCGGGSALDAAKAISALLTNPGDPLDYLEVVGRGQPLSSPAAPCIAIPTTAGTGSEVTRNAVLGVPERRVKVSLRSPYMLPRVAIVDPDLTDSLPADVTAYTGLDALTQVIEPYVSRRANPMTDPICREGIARAARSLRRAFEEGGDRAAREEMALVALFGGMALANAGLGAVHGFAGPLGGMFPAPHGAVCASLLPHVIALNIQALRARMPESDALRRYGEIARILTGDAQATPESGAAWVLSLCQALQIPPLRRYGVREEDIPEVVEKAAVASSMQGNPVVLTPEEMAEILRRAI